MKLAVLLLVAVSLSSGQALAKGKGKAKGKAAPPAAAAAAPATAAAEPAQGGTGGDPPAAPGAAEKAMAAPAAKFEEAGLYTISTEIGGESYGLTFIVPTDVRPGTLTTNGSKAKVELHKLTGGPEQVWRPVDAGVVPPMSLLYAKISDDESRLTGLLVLSRPDLRFIDADEYYDKYNRPTVSYHNGDVSEYWYIVKLDNGKYKVMSAKGHPSNMNKPGETWPEKWNESRWLEAVKVGGQVKLRHRRASDAPGQEWTFTKVGTYFKG